MRQAKPGKGGSRVGQLKDGNLSMEPSGQPTPPGKAGHSQNRGLRESCGNAGREAYTGSVQAA